MAEEYLKKLWYDPEHGFAGPDKLYDLVQKQGKFKISKKKIDQFLRDQDAYSLQKGVIRKFKRSRVIVEGIDSMFDGDLADMQNVSKYNDNITFLLIVIDVFSRFLWIIPLENKLGKTIVNALQLIFKQGRKPNMIRFDKGSEFNNRWVKTYLASENIAVIFTENETKANYAERVIRTLKNMIYRHFTANQTYRYVDVLQSLVSNYNTSPHRSLGKWTPASITRENENEARYMIYLARAKSPLIDKKYKFSVGEKVRISHIKHPFLRDYQQKWTEELFIIVKRYKREGMPIYRLTDFMDETISGTFYERELQMVNKEADAIWRIEKVLKRRKRNGRNEIFVKWAGWRAKFNSWVQQRDVV